MAAPAPVPWPPSLDIAGRLAPPAATGTGTATLNWSADTAYTDGSQITDLVGYNVWQGPSTSGLAKISGATLLSPATLTYKVTGLAPGTYVFAVTAVSKRYGESDPAPASFTSRSSLASL